MRGLKTHIGHMHKDKDLSEHDLVDLKKKQGSPNRSSSTTNEF